MGTGNLSNRDGGNHTAQVDSTSHACHLPDQQGGRPTSRRLGQVVS